MICDGYVHLIVGQDFQRFPWQYLFSIQTVVFQSYRSVSLSRSSHSHREEGWVVGGRVFKSGIISKGFMYMIRCS